MSTRRGVRKRGEGREGWRRERERDIDIDIDIYFVGVCGKIFGGRGVCREEMCCFMKRTNTHTDTDTHRHTQTHTHAPTNTHTNTKLCAEVKP